MLPIPITFDLSELITSWGDSLSFGPNTELGEPAPAEVISNPGATNGNYDPLLHYFPEDTIVVDEVSTTVVRWQDGWQPHQVVVQKLYSASQDITWANAYVPDDTFVFIREQEIVNGTQPVQGLIKAEGLDYLWAQSGPLTGDTASQACVSIPILSFGVGHDIYDHICTDFS